MYYKVYMDMDVLGEVGEGTFGGYCVCKWCKHINMICYAYQNALHNWEASTQRGSDEPAVAKHECLSTYQA